MGEAIAEQTLIAQLQESAGLYNPTTTAESAGMSLYATDEKPQQAHYPVNNPLLSTDAFAASPLVQAASAANQQLEQAQAGHNSSLVDPKLNETHGPLQAHAQLEGASVMNDQEGDTDAMIWNPTRIFGAEQTFGSLSMPSNEPTPGFGVLQKSAKSKARGRFNDERRKQVSDIRKQGACIRCRMLKKSCSGETPCSTCRNVENARLWKGKCLRTRLADEFTLFSTHLFYTRAKIEVPAAVQGLEQLSLPGRIEARFFLATDLCVSFSAKVRRDSNIDLSSTGGGDTEESDRNDRNEIWLLDDNEAMSDKLEEYAKQVADAFVQEEPSIFMRATLQRAQTLVRVEEAELATKVANGHDQTSPRSCYNLQNQLLKNVVELWIQTRLLASSDKHVLQLLYDPTRTPRHLPDSVNRAIDDEPPKVRSIPETSPSYRVIKAQLTAATESRFSKLSKTVMNELERRLLQRQQVSRFATFLSAVILLNCVERMTGLYRTFDKGEQPIPSPYPGNATADNEHEAEQANLALAWGDMSYRLTDHPNFWPLEYPPSILWPQGPHFADLLAMLLRMRALPPKTSQSSDGVLMAIQDYSLPVHVNGKPVREQVDEETRTTAAWLDPLRLRVTELVGKRDGQLPGKDEAVEAWDMIFVSKVLLPEKIRCDE